MNTDPSSQGTEALRSGRYSGRNQIYHIVSCTVERRNLFDNLRTGREVVKSMRHEDKAQHTTTLAFVVMPDHLHWLVQLNSDRSLSVIVNKVKSQSARHVNMLLRQSGRVWQKGYFDRAIRQEDDIAAVARYIVANPLRRGLVRRIGDYPLWDAVWV